MQQEPVHIQRARAAIDKIVSKDINRVYSHIYPDLDSLCSMYLLKLLNRSLRFEFVSIPFHGVEKLPLDSVAIDILGGAIDHHDLSGKHWSTCKIIYYILDSAGLTENIEKMSSLVDYCHRGDFNALKDGEKEQGSLIHTMYGLRDHIPAQELFNVYEYLATASLNNTPILTSMSDITAAAMNPKYSDILTTENIEKPALIRKFVRFIEFGKPNRGQSLFVAVNKSNHNIINIVFEYYRNVIAVIYCSPNGRSGIIIRKDSPVVFDLQAVRDYLVNEKKEPSWFLHSNKKMLLCGSKKMEISSSIDSEELVELLYKHRI